MDDFRLGVLIPIGQAQWGAGTDPRELIDFAVQAEELGYSSLWANDFLLTPRIEALTMLAAAAPVTRTVTLGTAALLPVLRRPVQAAQTLASIDLLSGGRLVLAVGAAFPGRFGLPQHELSEVPWERRFTRLDETVALWRQLWTRPDLTSFHGEVLRFDGLPPMTAPARPGGPPIWLGGGSPSALRRVGRIYDGWLPYPPSPAAYADGLAAVRAAATEAGRSADGQLRPAAGSAGDDPGSRGGPARACGGPAARLRGRRGPPLRLPDRHHEPGHPAGATGAAHQAQAADESVTAPWPAAGRQRLRGWVASGHRVRA